MCVLLFVSILSLFLYAIRTRNEQQFLTGISVLTK
jgi:hypothetical protein